MWPLICQQPIDLFYQARSFGKSAAHWPSKCKLCKRMCHIVPGCLFFSTSWSRYIRRSVYLLGNQLGTMRGEGGEANCV